jgi:hypothetical protein
MTVDIYRAVAFCGLRYGAWVVLGPSGLLSRNSFGQNEQQSRQDSAGH